MEHEPQGPDSQARPTALIRIGGLTLLVAFAIHIVANSVIKTMPPEDPTPEQLRAYLDEQVDAWAIVHGLRYIAIIGIAVFAAALFTRTCRLREPRPIGWGALGLLGAAVWLTNLIITNGIETALFLDPDIVSNNTDTFWALFNLTRVLFTAEIVAWAIFIGAFSVCGWLSRTLPRWLCAFGYASAAAGVLCGVFIVSVMTDGPGAILIEIAAIGSLLWYLCTGVYLLAKGAS